LIRKLFFFLFFSNFLLTKIIIGISLTLYASLITIASMFDERVHNYPDGFEKKPWCPQTKLINICGDLAGISYTPEKFCTQEHASLLDSLNGDSALYPVTACYRINQALVAQMEILGTHPQKPSQEEAERKVQSTHDINKQAEIIKKFKEKEDIYNEREGTMTRWRQVIYENCYTKPGDELNEHFSQVASADELTDDDVLSKARIFIKVLQKITGIEPAKKGFVTIDLGMGAAHNCPQTPHYREADVRTTWDF